MNIGKIMLLCTGLEAGADGIGDYCRRLAEELSKQGVQCLVIALNDRKITSERLEQPSASVQLLRLPEHSSVWARSARLSSMLSSWGPDWVSLQFVCYGFNRKGLPFKELLWLPALLRNCSLHVMLHELWVGLDHPTSIKSTIVGSAQRFLILWLLRRLQPNAMHTSNHYDRQVLTSYGIKADILPLFGNIPPTAEPAGKWLANAIRENDGPDIRQDRRRLWLFGLFGSVGPDWPATILFPRLARIARESDRHIVVVSAGHPGPHAKALFERWRHDYREIDFVAIGPRSADEISQFLNSVDFGLAPSPLRRLAKSGSIAAMIEHGLPVVVGSDGPTSEAPATSTPFESLIWQNDARLPTRLKNPPVRVRRPDWCAVVAKSLLSRLQKAAV